MAKTANSGADALRNTDTPTISGTDSNQDIATNWAKLMAAYLAAKAEEEAYAEKIWNPANERQEAFTKARGVANQQLLLAEHPEEFIPDAVNEEMDRLQNVYLDFRDELIQHPAPHAAALRWKLDFLLGEDDGNNWNRDFIEQTKADYHRLLSGRPGFGDDPVSRYWTAFDAYNNGTGTERSFKAACRALDAWGPTDLRDFVRKYEAIYCDDACPNRERSRALMQQAVALLGGERSAREG